MKNRIVKTIAVIALLGFVFWEYGCCTKNVVGPIGIDREITVLGADVVYAQRQVFDLKTMQTITVDLKMDIIAPKTANTTNTPRPLIVFFHGYNPLTYNNQSPESYKYYNQHHDALMLKFAQRHNCVVALVDFVPTTLKWEDIALNFAKTEKCKVACFQPVDPLYDAIEGKRNCYFMVRQGKEAVRFLKSKHLDYDFDLNNITVAGFSAGGGIAAGVAFMTDPSFRPSYTNAQPDVIYDNNNKYPNGLINLSLPGINCSFNKSYQEMPPTFANPLPRPDLGNLEGAITTTYDSKIKNVVLLNTGIIDPIIINQVGPRLFIFGHDNDETLKKEQKLGTVACTNRGTMTIFSGIKSKAESAGYQNGVNLKVIQSPTNGHEYSFPNNMIGGYTDITKAIWDFID